MTTVTAASDIIDRLCLGYSCKSTSASPAMQRAFTKYVFNDLIVFSVGLNVVSG